MSRSWFWLVKKKPGAIALTLMPTLAKCTASHWVKFETAALRGYAFAREHEEETLDILEAYSGENRDFLRAQIYGTENYTPAMRLSLDPDSDACVAFYQAMEHIGAIENVTDVDWDQYVVTDVYRTALADLSAREPGSALWAELTDYFEAHNT